jgi:subtilisin family serine protease
MKLTFFLAAAATLAALGLTASGGTARAATLVQLRPGAPASAPRALEQAGATLVVPSLHVWRLPAGASTGVLRSLGGAVSFTESERSYTVAAVPSDPLSSSEWWRADVHVDTLEPPGPGVPVTVVDSGVKFAHPEFVNRPNLIALDAQEPAPIGGVHGTAVSSVVGAPVNGVGLVGIYPQAIIRSYDASLGDGTRLPVTDIANGIVAAARAGRSVINLSLGGPGNDRLIDAAVHQAVKAGSLVVAASGNSGEEDNELSYPGANAHVLTIGATDQSDAPASFTTRSPYVDLAAPGVDIPVASALDDSWQPESGTSFSSPMVAGAAAWLWTVRPTLDAGQVAEILRTSARDVATPGYDESTGYGILDMAAALAAPTPAPDLPEPNDDVTEATTVTRAGSTTATASGRVVAFEDPRDVLRVFMPARKTLTVKVTSSGVGVTVAGVSRTAKTFTVSVRNGAKARSVFLTVKPQSGVRDATYTLKISAR